MGYTTGIATSISKQSFARGLNWLHIETFKDADAITLESVNKALESYGFDEIDEDDFSDLIGGRDVVTVENQETGRDSEIDLTDLELWAERDWIEVLEDYMENGRRIILDWSDGIDGIEFNLAGEHIGWPTVFLNTATYTVRGPEGEFSIRRADADELTDAFTEIYGDSVEFKY